MSELNKLNNYSELHAPTDSSELSIDKEESDRVFKNAYNKIKNLYENFKTKLGLSDEDTVAKTDEALVKIVETTEDVEDAETALIEGSLEDVIDTLISSGPNPIDTLEKDNKGLVTKSIVDLAEKSVVLPNGDKAAGVIIEHLEAEESKIEEIDVMEKMKIQKKIICEWASQQDPPLVEGVDFYMPSIDDIDRGEETIAPHELGNMYFGFKKEHFKKITEFFAFQYPEAMHREQSMLKPWNSGINFNYSWGGRYLISGEGGVAIDTVPLESIDPPLCKPEHIKFKEFFHEQTGIDFPSIQELNDIMKAMVSHLSWYIEAVKRLEENQNTSPTPWEYEQPINSLKYAVIILSDAKELSETENALAKQKGAGIQNPELEDKISKLRLEELPEEFSDTRDKIRHYNDLTYNADDWVDLDHVNELLGGEFPPPSEKGGRIDKIYEDYYDFDRKKFEQLCKEFSHKLYTD